MAANRRYSHEQSGGLGNWGMGWGGIRVLQCGRRGLGELDEGGFLGWGCVGELIVSWEQGERDQGLMMMRVVDLVFVLGV